MKRATGLAAASILVLAAGVLPAQSEPPGAERLPPGAGREATLRRCVACHALDVVANKRARPADWFAIVEDMRGRGAPLTDEEVVEIAAYLGKALPEDGG